MQNHGSASSAERNGVFTKRGARHTYSAAFAFSSGLRFLRYDTAASAVNGWRVSFSKLLCDAVHLRLAEPRLPHAPPSSVTSAKVRIHLIPGPVLGEQVTKVKIHLIAGPVFGDQVNGLKVSQVKRLRELEKENARLRKAVSDLTLDEMILQEAARGTSEPPGRRCACVSLVCEKLQVSERRASDRSSGTGGQGGRQQDLAVHCDGAHQERDGQLVEPAVDQRVPDMYGRHEGGERLKVHGPTRSFLD